MYQKILVAVDGSESSKRALNEAVRMASLGKGSVHCVYVVDKSALFTYAGYYDPVALLDAFRRDGTEALEAAGKAVAAAGLAGDTELVETESAGDDVAACLQRCAQRYGAELVVMGTHGRRGVRRVVLGSVAERFLRFSTCPVLLVRSDDVEKAAAKS
ncbi:universal stress protein [Paraburkholderia sp. A1RI_3L]|jgi:nucleotide-binding universal stress UspA family protein|uniref:universal stress protein n=1 Tax=Paraburkholderia TaxID=1822464 RepID=UPI000F874676|nr:MULTISPECIES: universal stress protein [Paraburkholderia]WEY40734.1 universal stress protein [Paraburkholderia sp. SUR17]